MVFCSSRMSSTNYAVGISHVPHILFFPSPTEARPGRSAGIGRQAVIGAKRGSRTTSVPTTGARGRWPYRHWSRWSLGWRGGGSHRIQRVAERASREQRGSRLLCLRQTTCTIQSFISHTVPRGFEGGLLNVHNPFCSLAVRFGHLLDDQAENVSGLIEESGLDNIMSKYMRRHSPLFPMLDMCIYASFVDGAEFVFFVYHGCLSQPWTRPIWIFKKVSRYLVLGNLGRSVNGWFGSRWARVVLGFCRWGALWDLRCGGIARLPIGKREARARKGVWMKDVEASDDSEEKDEGSQRWIDLADHGGGRGRDEPRVRRAEAWLWLTVDYFTLCC